MDRGSLLTAQRACLPRPHHHLLPGVGVPGQRAELHHLQEHSGAPGWASTAAGALWNILFTGAARGLCHLCNVA